jgi:peptidoglycan/xylan/chitin deacetylase (PgdA/CDA1 family)
MSRFLELVAGVQRRVPFGVALTFDEVSPGLLDALAAAHARATFFLADVDGPTVHRMRADGHGVGWRTDDAHDELTRLDGRVPRLHRPALQPRNVVDALRFRRRRLDVWLWSLDGTRLDNVRDRDVVRLEPEVDVDAALAMIHARRLDLVAL